MFVKYLVRLFEFFFLFFGTLLWLISLVANLAALVELHAALVICARGVMLAGQPWSGGSKVGLHSNPPIFCGCMSCCCCCCCCREETEGRTALYYIIQCVTQGDRLELPSLHDLQAQGLTETLATPLLQLTLQCWAQLAVERPTMTEVGVAGGRGAAAETTR
jgi:hypothetical protein